jgi:hypothetical protein
MSAHRQISRTTGRPTSRSTLGARRPRRRHARTGVGFFDHMLDLLARHGRLGPRRRGHRRPADRRAPHRRGHRDRARAGAATARSATARDRRYGARRRADGRGARRLRDRHLGPPVCASRASALPPGTSPASSTRPRRSSSAPWPSAAR